MQLKRLFLVVAAMCDTYLLPDNCNPFHKITAINQWMY